MILAALAACGKNEAPSNAPELAPPERAFTSAATGGEKEIPAEAEVKASSGPVELTLKIFKIRIKADERVWFRLRVRNVGDRKMLLSDQIFHDPEQLNRNFRIRWGIFIEALGPDGTPLEEALHREEAEPVRDRVSGMLNIAGPVEQAMVDGWRKQGLTEYEVNEKLVHFNLKKEREEASGMDRPVFNLKPGEAAETKSSFFYSTYDRLIKKRPPPKPIGGFSQLELFDFEGPGKYKIRAVYNYVRSGRNEAIAKKIGLGPSAEDVLVHTQWVQFEVLP